MGFEKHHHKNVQNEALPQRTHIVAHFGSKRRTSHSRGKVFQMIETKYMSSLFFVLFFQMKFASGISQRVSMLTTRQAAFVTTRASFARQTITCSKKVSLLHESSFHKETTLLFSTSSASTATNESSTQAPSQNSTTSSSSSSNTSSNSILNPSGKKALKPKIKLL
mmetsp:Transcript_30757/g.45880  ORF Transcript_30757/g.45880 Transcript_30757/m.45880 type:complete len:166 (+) Transcript_30757:2-499(+)